MAANWVKSRQTKYWSYAGVYILVILALLAGLNFLANRYDKSYDSTANKQFSLSDQTIKVVHDLKRDVKVTYFGASGHLARGVALLLAAVAGALIVGIVGSARMFQVRKRAKRTQA